MTRRLPPRTTALTGNRSVLRPADTTAPPVGINHDSPEPMSDEERAAAQRGLADLRAGRFATAAEVEAAFRRFRP